MARVKLGDVAREYKVVCKGAKDGLPVVGLEHLTPQDITLSSWDEGKDNTFTKMFREGQVLFGRRRAYLKKAAIAPFDGICSGDITVIESLPDRILPNLLPFIIQNDSLFDYAVGKSAGSLSPRVKWEQLKDYSFELPALDEQRKLADILWAAHNTKEAYKRLLAETDDLVKSQFIEMFGDPVTNPMGWPIIELGDCLISIDSGTSLNCDNHPRTQSEPAVLKLSAVTYGQYQPSENKVLPDPERFVKCKSVHKGDLLFSRKNTYEYVGMSAYVYETPENLMLPDLIFRLNTDSCCNRVYLWKLINHDRFRALISVLAGGTASSMPNISKQKLSCLRIALPPLELQNRFAAFVESTDKSKFALQQNIERLEMCRNALMKKAFG